MKRKIQFFCVILILQRAFKQINCLNCSDNNFQLIVDYAKWRDIKSLAIYDDSCAKDASKSHHILCFSAVGFSVSFHNSVKNVKNITNMTGHKIGLVFFLNDIDHNFTNFFHQEENISWLIIANDSRIVDKLKFTTLGLNTDLVVAIPTVSLCLKQDCGMTPSLNQTDPNSDYEYLNKSQYLPQPTPVYAHYEEAVTNHCNSDGNLYCLLQLYKVRKELNDSLLVHVLGLWNNLHGTKYMSPFMVTEKRTNMYKFPLKFGRQNQTNSEIHDDVIEQKLMEISSYFEQFLNASVEITNFEKLGRKENAREWTDLLGAVINKEVDLGVASVIVTPERYDNMAFSQKIFTSLRNIYIKHQPSNELRDIYLTPFDIKLTSCVIIAGVVLSLMMGVVAKISTKKGQNSFGEATLWCIGIFTMQGSVWTPKSCSGNIILITSLALALVIFNAYSAFITSVLSVERAYIRSVDDLLESDYNIGYVKNSQDESYLRSMNDTNLQLIYLRGYLHNTVLNVTQGLEKSMREDYGFFASANVARKELQRINNYKCNHDMMEIPVPNTKNMIAFPMATNSPYRKVFNLMIMKMYENGMHKYFYSQVVPEYSKCDEKRIFRGAHLTDLSSAFGVLLIGVVLSLLLVVGECLWKKKNAVWYRMKKNRHFIFW